MCQENTVVYPPLSERELNGAKIAKKVAKEGMVLLDNHENTLPLTPGPIWLSGRSGEEPVQEIRSTAVCSAGETLTWIFLPGIIFS